MTITNCAIHLDSLRFYAYHGVLEQERLVGGHYTVDLVLTLNDCTAAIDDDDLSGTVNYAEVYEAVRKEMAQPSALLEHVAGRILRRILTDFSRVETARITLRKDTPPMGADCDGCAVVLEVKK